MPDINLTIKLKSINVSKATERFLKVKPNTETKPKAGAVINKETGEYNLEDLELKYNLKEWVEEVCRRHIYRQIKVGDGILQNETRDILEPQEDYLS